MAKSVKNFNFQAVEKKETVVEIIEQLYLGLKSGKLELKTEREKILLSMHDPIDVQISAQSSESNSVLSIELSWYNPLPQEKKLILAISVPESKKDGEGDE